jgi:hypothetical protein
VTAQKAANTDTNARLAQQWEDVLLMEAADYLQLTPKQIVELQSMAEYAQSRADEIDRQRSILKKMVEDQHQALLQGKHPTASDQGLAIRKEREIKEMEARISEEVVNRLTPKFGAVLTRKQFARAWQLVHGKTPAGESQRVALYDPDSGFVLPGMESANLRGELVRSILRSTYSDNELNAALSGSIPIDYWINARPENGIAFTYSDKPVVLNASPSRSADVVLSPPDPAEAAGTLSIVTRDHALAEFELDAAESPHPEVPKPVRDAINRSANQIRSGLDKDPESILKSASSKVTIDALRHLTKRMFLSPRIKEALESRAPKGT